MKIKIENEYVSPNEMLHTAGALFFGAGIAAIFLGSFNSFASERAWIFVEIVKPIFYYTVWGFITIFGLFLMLIHVSGTKPAESADKPE